MTGKLLMPYLTINRGGLELHTNEPPPRRYELTPEGGAAFQRDLLAMGVDKVMCSSTLDFPEECGVSRAWLEQFFNVKGVMAEVRHPTYTDRIDWSLIPPGMVGGLRRYFEQGIKPGSFLLAVLCNDFMEAVARADDNNRLILRNYAVFLDNYAPRGCYGSPKAVNEWAARGGLGWPEVYNG